MLGHHYDYQSAAELLETLARTRTSTGYLAHPLARYAKDIPRGSFIYTNTHSANTDMWRVMEHASSPEEPEEAVFTIHGIIGQCDLPPIVKPYPKQSAAKHVQQKVTLCGFDSPTFNDAINGILLIDNHLRLNVRENGPTQYLGQHNEHTTVEIGNRYFTSKRLSPTNEHIPFSTVIDPKGILNDLRGDFFLHTAENQVEYYERYTVNNEQRFRTVSPAFIKCGDIVEVQLTVALIDYSLGKNGHNGCKYITKLVLRSVTLLDQTFSENCRLAGILPSKRVSLKRKIGHDEEESMEAQERLKRMTIDRE